MAADLAAAAVEVESNSTLSLAGLWQKKKDYSAFGPILCETRGQKMLHIDLHDIKSCYSLKTPLDIILDIEGNKDLMETLLNEHLLLATLHTLWISYVWNLKSLDEKGLEHLTSLQQLQILSCKSLQFLPKEASGVVLPEEDVSEKEGKRLEKHISYSLHKDR
ncbi:hypothetical protein DVH24_038186 [Malus domestica]|uniref:NB-ARC domain-containing protein n=1 Tax=Malus domestica TaxID=3750 RepID=A0A498KEF0_MALDO|nr:hypothetical protein DVH24_038186 [Malus domestica]